MKKETNRILLFLFLAALIFILGFIIASLQQKQQWEYPPTIVQTDSIKTSTLLDRSYFNLTLETINSAQERIDAARQSHSVGNPNRGGCRVVLSTALLTSCRASDPAP